MVRMKDINQITVTSKKMMIKFIIIIFILSCKYSFGQINYLTSFTRQINLVKLHVNGYKYVETNINDNTIKIYNTDNSIFKIITIPTQGIPIQSIGYISENLFDLDNDIEYYITTLEVSNGYTQFKIYNENGTILFQKDSANLYQTTSTQSYGLYISDPIFYDGISTKMKLQINSRTELYNLLGSVTCFDCTSGIVSGLIDEPNNQIEKFDRTSIFFPNPTNDFIKINYQLPSNYKNAEIVIYDNNGKLIETLQITSTFDCVYLNSKYAGGLYFFNLIVDGNKIKTEKIIMNK